VSARYLPFILVFPSSCGDTLKYLTAYSLVAALMASAAGTYAQTDDAALTAKARRIHSRVLTIDSHNDIDPSNFTPACNYSMRLRTQVNLPKMVEGGLDVSFMVVYVGQGPLTPDGYDRAYRQAVAKFIAIHRLTEQLAPDKIGLALSPADVLALHKQGKKVAVIGVENGYPLGLDVRRVQEFYDRGARYMSLAHNGNNQLADSNTGERDGYFYRDGLSPEGREVISEMNRVGIMVDLSHPSKGSNLEAIKLSKAPVIASHSGVRALAPNVKRDMDDEQLLALKKNGGVIQILGFMLPQSPERTKAIATLEADPYWAAPVPRADAESVSRSPCPVEGPAGVSGGLIPPEGSFLYGLPSSKRAEYELRLAEINEKFPARQASVKDLVNQIDYAVRLIGIDHVGIASDFDGGGGVTGWMSADETFNVTLELVRRGYSEQEIAKLWGGNLLRVWAEVQKEARKEQRAKSSARGAR